MSASTSVCHLTSVHKWDDVRIFVKLCTSLAGNGYQVFLVAPGAPDITRNGVTIVGVPAPGGRIRRILSTTSAVYQKALVLNCDVFHIHDPELLPVAFKLLKKGKKVIYDVHEDLPRQVFSKPYFPEWTKKTLSVIIEKIENFYASRLSAICAATPVIRDRFLKYNRSTIDVCNYPVNEGTPDSEDYHSKPEEACYVGGITEVRGIREIVRACFQEKITLNLAGPADAGFLKSLENDESWSAVNYHGILDRAGVAAVYRRSRLGFVTLYPQPNYLDALPVKMFEYMAHGIPFIASDFPLWRKISNETKAGVCVDPQDVDSIRKAMRYIIDSPGKAEEMGFNGKEAVLKKFNWANEEKKLLQLYRNVLQTP